MKLKFKDIAIATVRNFKDFRRKVICFKVILEQQNKSIIYGCKESHLKEMDIKRAQFLL
jgi:hypothetical protein